MGRRRLWRRLVIVAAVVLLGVVVFAITFKPLSRPPSAETVERTPARLERGRYLVEAVLGCMDCHAPHDATRFGFPAVGPGSGGECLDRSVGVPGVVCPTNITSEPETGLGRWSDGEIMRALREGVSRDGRALFPAMPYEDYRALSDEDARAAVAHLRTLPPVRNAVPAPEFDLIPGFFIKLMPRPLEGPVPGPEQRDRIARGRYLAKVSGCERCHTPVDRKRRPLEGQEMSGGQRFKGPWGVRSSSNLTPHPTGLGDRDEKAFVGAFKSFASVEPPVVDPKQNTAMPWLTRSRMTEEDLGAIHAFLRTLRPIERSLTR